MSINDIELHHLRCLIALAEELNFGRAAERMHMSQPPLTRLVADVEKTLGASLFARTTRRVALTPVGEVVVAEARAVLARMDEALENVAAAAARESGLLRLGYTWLALQTVLPQLLSVFREQDHDARVDLAELAGGAQAALEAGRVDLAFCDESVKASGYANVLLHRDPLSLLVPEAHPFAARSMIGLREIGSESLILHPRHEYPDYYDRILAAFEEAGAALNICQREAGQNCLALVVSGAGVLLTPTAPDRFQAPGLRCVPVESTALLCADVWASWAETNSSSRVAALVEVIQGQSWKQPVSSI